jgi:hypothetical protein
MTILYTSNSSKILYLRHMLKACEIIKVHPRMWETSHLLAQVKVIIRCGGKIGKQQVGSVEDCLHRVV